MRLLVVTAVARERDAVLATVLGRPRRVTVGRHEALAADTRAGEVVVVAGGVGAAAAAAVTATALALDPSYGAVLSIGIGGGFGEAHPGSVVVATEFVAADLGADSPDGFLPLAELGMGASTLPAGPGAAALATRVRGVAGPVLTVSTVTGTDERAAELAARWNPCAEAMEGFGVAVAAGPYGVPAYELRTISNRCGRRDRGAWNIKFALVALSYASARLFDGPLPPMEAPQ